MFSNRYYTVFWFLFFVSSTIGGMPFYFDFKQKKLIYCKRANYLLKLNVIIVSFRVSFTYFQSARFFMAGNKLGFHVSYAYSMASAVPWCLVMLALFKAWEVGELLNALLQFLKLIQSKIYRKTYLHENFSYFYIHILFIVNQPNILIFQTDTFIPNHIPSKSKLSLKLDKVYFSMVFGVVSLCYLACKVCIRTPRSPMLFGSIVPEQHFTPLVRILAIVLNVHGTIVVYTTHASFTLVLLPTASSLRVWFPRNFL